MNFLACGKLPEIPTFSILNAFESVDEVVKDLAAIIDHSKRQVELDNLPGMVWARYVSISVSYISFLFSMLVVFIDQSMKKR